MGANQNPPKASKKPATIHRFTVRPVTVEEEDTSDPAKLAAFMAFCAKLARRSQTRLTTAWQPTAASGWRCHDQEAQGGDWHSRKARRGVRPGRACDPLRALRLAQLKSQIEFQRGLIRSLSAADEMGKGSVKEWTITRPGNTLVDWGSKKPS